MESFIKVGDSDVFSEDWRELIAHYEKLCGAENERPEWVDEAAWAAIIRGRALEAAVLAAGRVKAELLMQLLQEPGFQREYDRTIEGAEFGSYTIRL